MEIKINREIRDYTETMFFGLSARQFFFSLAALAVAVVLYLLLKPVLGTETFSWLCILAAAPFAVMGFVKYHGMSAEKFLWVWIRSELLEPKELKCLPVNYYYEACDLNQAHSANRKEDRHCVKNTEDPVPDGQGEI